MKLILSASVILFVACSLCAQTIPAWKVGDGWHVSVEMFPKPGTSEPKPDQKPVRYDMHIVVLASQKVDGFDCWNVDFLIPDPKPPAGLTGRYRLCVDAADGWPRKAFRFRDYRNLSFEQFE